MFSKQWNNVRPFVIIICSVSVMFEVKIHVHAQNSFVIYLRSNACPLMAGLLEQKGNFLLSHYAVDHH